MIYRTKEGKFSVGIVSQQLSDGILMVLRKKKTK